MNSDVTKDIENMVLLAIKNTQYVCNKEFADWLQLISNKWDNDDQYHSSHMEKDIKDKIKELRGEK